MKNEEKSKKELIKEIKSLKKRVSEMEREFLCRKSLEEENIKLTEELEKKTKENSLQVDGMNIELETLTYSISHDLRTPLRTIDGFSQILLTDYSSNLDEEGLDFFRRIRKNTKYMGELIDNLLKLSRINKEKLYFEKVDLSKLVLDISDELKNMCSGRDVKFIIKPGVIVKGDRLLLKIVINNLIDNAWKFTSKRADSLVEFGTEKIEDHIDVYFVRDNGAGFNIKYARKLFGPFQRFHETFDFPGTGIGLATVKRIIHRHNGRIWAESEENKGSTFYFTLNEF